MVTSSVPSITCDIMSWREKLKISRERAGLSQDELGKAVGVSGSAINLWENGPTYPSVKNLLKAADECRFDLSWIFSSDPDEYPSDAARAAKAAFAAKVRAIGPEKVMDLLLAEAVTVEAFTVKEFRGVHDEHFAKIVKFALEGKKPADLKLTTESDPTPPRPRRRRKKAEGPKQLPAPSRSDQNLHGKDEGADS